MEGARLRALAAKFCRRSVGVTRIAIASYLPRGDPFDRAIADFSVKYADQNERENGAFVTGMRSRRLAAVTHL